MKTIEITSGNQKALFTTKSMTFHGREFLYANMTDVVNHTDIHTYTFVYDGVSKAFPYEEKDAKVLNAIFSQVQGMQAEKSKPASGGKKPASQPSGTDAQKGKDTGKPAAAPGENAAKEKAQTESLTDEKAAGQEMPADSGKSKADSQAQEQTTKPEGGKALESQGQASGNADEKGSGKTPQASGGADEKKTGKPSVKGIFSAAKKKKGEQKDAPSEGIDVDPHRQAKLKKSFTIFGIIIAIFIVLSLILYFVFGTSSDPAPSNPSSTESQQYNDIDELINDLQ